jgi:hypothetical protein
MNKPEPREIVYLAGNCDWRILRDGPALRLRRQQHTDQLLPLRRIAHINSLGPINWDSAALLGCASHGITVHFCSHKGERLGCFNPARPARTSVIGEALEQAIQHPQLYPFLRSWMRAQKRIALNRLKLEECKDLSTRQRTALACQWLGQYSRGALKRTWRQLELLLETDLHHRLWEQGIESHSTACKIRGIDIAQEISEGILLQLMPAMLNQFDQLTVPRQGKLKPDFAVAVKLHQQLKRKIERTLDEYLFQLHHALLEAQT